MITFSKPKVNDFFNKDSVDYPIEEFEFAITHPLHPDNFIQDITNKALSIVTSKKKIEGVGPNLIKSISMAGAAVNAQGGAYILSKMNRESTEVLEEKIKAVLDKTKILYKLLESLDEKRVK